MMKSCCEVPLAASTQEEIFKCDLVLMKKIIKSTKSLFKNGYNFNYYLDQILVFKTTLIVL